MKNLAVARRYAKALLLIGKEDGKAQDYKQEIAAVADMIETQPTLEQALLNPLYDVEARRKVLEAIIKQLKLSAVMSSFLLLLFDKRRIGFIGAISDFYQKLADELQGIARASLVSASKLSADTIDKIKSALSTRTGKEVILDVQQDPELIGGIVTKIGDLVLDGSIKTQLLNMRETLKRGESV